MLENPFSNSSNICFSSSSRENTLLPYENMASFSLWKRSQVLKDSLKLFALTPPNSERVHFSESMLFYTLRNTVHLLRACSLNQKYGGSILYFFLSFGQETCYEQLTHPASCPIPDCVTQARSSLWVRKHLEIGSPFLANAFPGNARVSPFCKGHYIASCTKIESDLTELATATEVLFPRGSPSAVCMHYSSAAHNE